MSAWVHRGLFISLLVASIFLSGKKTSKGEGQGGEAVLGFRGEGRCNTGRMHGQ